MANKHDIIAAVAAKTGTSKREAHEFVDAVFSSIHEKLAADGEIKLVGFGTFKVKDRAPRKARNMQTGEEILVPATKVPTFKPSQALKDAVK